MAARRRTALGIIRFCHVSSSTVGTMALVTERLSEVCEQYDALYSRWNTLNESQMATVTCANAPARRTQGSSCVGAPAASHSESMRNAMRVGRGI